MRVLRFLNDHIEEYLMSALLAAMSVIIFVQVIMRYVFTNSLSWSEEIARYIFVWIAYLAISYGVKVSAHIRVDVFLMLLPKRLRKPVKIVSNFLFLICSLLIVWAGVQVVRFILSSNQSSPALNIPMGLVYLAVPVGFALVTLRLVQNTITLFKEKGEE